MTEAETIATACAVLARARREARVEVLRHGEAFEPAGCEACWCVLLSFVAQYAHEARS